MVLFIKVLVLTPLNKMELLREAILICLRLLAVCYYLSCPQKLLVVCCLVGLVLTNRMLSRVLQLKSPISLLCPQQPLFAMSLGVFGCLLFHLFKSKSREIGS